MPIFYDSGSTIDAGSTAVIYDKHLYIGQIYGKGILRCPVDGGTQVTN